MGKTGQFAEKQTAVQSTGFEKFKTVMSKINSVINLIGVWLFRLRKFIMAAPVIYAAIRLASYNGQHLPEQVGLDLQSTGEFAMTVSRQLAVMGPLGLTAACLLLMFCSRKAMYPWAISIFTLALPVLLLLQTVRPLSELHLPSFLPVLPDSWKCSASRFTAHSAS